MPMNDEIPADGGLPRADVRAGLRTHYLCGGSAAAASKRTTV